MSGILTRFPNISCALEYCPAQIEELGFSSRDIIDFFHVRGFKLYVLERSGSLSHLTQTTLEAAVGCRGYANILATRRDIPV
jgi:hypothetical protein